jgi:hypothetical protein
MSKKKSEIRRRRFLYNTPRWLNTQKKGRKNDVFRRFISSEALFLTFVCELPGFQKTWKTKEKLPLMTP